MNWDPYDTPSVSHAEKQKLNALFVGRTVAKVSDDELLLDDGTRLKVVANEGCGGCTNGWYELKSLNGCENVIMRAEVVESYKPGEWGPPEGKRTYTLYVYANNQTINLATVEGDDGNGYYGTGFEIVVKRAEGSE